MGILITLRRDSYTSYFRNNLLALVSLGGNSLYLASGYFADIITNKNGSISQYSVLDDGLLTAITANNRIRSISIIGSMGGHGKNFQAFCKKIHKNWNGKKMDSCFNEPGGRSSISL